MTSPAPQEQVALDLAAALSKAEKERDEALRLRDVAEEALRGEAERHFDTSKERDELREALVRLSSGGRKP